MARPTELDLRDYGRILSRRKGWLIGASLAGVALAFGINALTEPVYRATVKIHVQREQNRSPITGDLTETPTANSENLALYTAAELITNRKLLARVVESLHERGVSLEGGESSRWWARVRGDQRTASAAMAQLPMPSSGEGRTTSQREIESLLHKIHVEPVRDTRLVNIHVEHSDPRAGEMIANAIADQFVQFQIDVRNAGSSHLITYLNDQLEEVRESLRVAEQASAYLESRAERIQLEAQLERASARDDDAANAGESALKRRLVENEAELAKARKIYKERHPRLVMLETENAQLRESVKSELRQATAGARARYNAALARERALAPSASGRSAAALQSELDNQREIYAALMTKLKEAEITSQVRQPLVEVVEAATADPSPVRPRKTLNFAVCLFAGMTVGTGLAFLREYLRRTIRTPQDVDDHLQLPVLGLIPKA